MLVIAVLAIDLRFVVITELKCLTFVHDFVECAGDDSKFRVGCVADLKHKIQPSQHLALMNCHLESNSTDHSFATDSQGKSILNGILNCTMSSRLKSNNV
jgi:hypothetical protein